MTRKSKALLGDLFPDLGLVGEFESLRSLEIHQISPVETAREGDLVFVAEEALLGKLRESAPSAAVVSDGLWQRVQALGLGFPLLRVKDAKLAFAKVSGRFRTEGELEAGVHPTALVHSSARLGSGVRVGPNAIVGEGAELGSGVVLHAGVNVGARVKLGEGTILFPGVVVYQDCRIGARVRIHANSVIGADGFGYAQEKVAGGVRHVKIHHLGGVSIGDDVEIGASTTIDRGTLGDTVVERGCIIDNQVQIGHNCRIGEGAVICGCTGLSGSAEVGRFAVLAGFVGVANKIRIGEGATVSAYSAVASHVPAGQVWGGIPVMPHRNWLRAQVLIGKLPELLGKANRGKDA